MTIFNYHINLVDVLFCIIVIALTYKGYKKGLFVTMLNFIKYVFGFTSSLYVANTFSQPVYEKYVRQSLIDYVNNNIKSNNLNDTIANFNDSVSSIPRDIRMMFGLENAQIIKTDDVTSYIVDNVLQPISLMVTKGVIFITVLLIISVVFGIITHRIIKRKGKGKSVTKKAVNFIDSLIGGVFGLIKSALLLFLIVSLVSVIATNAPEDLTGFVKTVDESYFYNLLIDYNPFNLITEGIIWTN